ncbi:MAG: FtsX-like permease family protein [Spirochaetales bacterium]|nr:FtsX-like permease family protein [Spirochaetales bacterium]
MIIFKIALRNLREHTAKTLIIGVLIAVGVFFLVAGNSFMDTITAGMRITYIDNYTGELIVHGKAKGTFSLFGIMGPEMANAKIPEIEQFEQLEALLASSELVSDVNPLATGAASIGIGEESAGFSFLWGIEPSQYFTMFPDNIILHEGTRLPPGEKGIMLSQNNKDKIREETNRTIHAGDKLQLSGMNAVSGTRIREVTVWGIFSYRQTSPQLERVSLVDIKTLRELSGMDVGEIEEAQLSETEQALLGEIEENNIFGSSLISTTSPQNEGFTNFETILAAEALEITEAGKENNAWHFLLLKTINDRAATEITNTLNDYFLENDLDLEVSNWRWGAGFTADMAYSLQIVFNIIIIVIFIVALIVIMNTLVISITERIPEIGTIRAMGGQKSFVRLMITTETLVITALFGTAGVLLGSIFIWILNMTGIEATNMFFRVLFGGDVLKPGLSANSIVSALAAVGILGAAASLYPVSVALKISPVRAMQKGI